MFLHHYQEVGLWNKALICFFLEILTSLLECFFVIFAITIELTKLLRYNLVNVFIFFANSRSVVNELFLVFQDFLHP